MPCISSACYNHLNPEAKSTIVAKLVNQEIILLATKDAACARHEAAVQPLDRSNIAVWV